MKPEIWGPHAWIFLHSITLEYPDHPTNEDKQNMTNFINALKYVLPCHKCKINFNDHLQSHPLTNNILSSKSNLIKWLIDIHNSVNKLTNKKELTYEAALAQLLQLYDHKPNYVYLYIGISLLIITFCIYLIKRKSH